MSKLLSSYSGEFYIYLYFSWNKILTLFNTPKRRTTKKFCSQTRKFIPSEHLPKIQLFIVTRSVIGRRTLSPFWKINKR